MVSSINLKMHAIGLICLKIFHHIQRFFLHYKQWREQGIFAKIMVILHGELRATVQKN